MRAMLITRAADLAKDLEPLELREVPRPVPGEREVLLKVLACGVCHTDIDEIEGRTPPPRLPVIPGHQVVGRVVERGRDAGRFAVGDRVGVAWIFSACGRCAYCRSGRENLCPDFRGTGRDADGGYAEYMKVGEAFAHPIPEVFSDVEAAPLLCAGAVGYRALRLSGIADGDNFGLTGFGASNHLVLLTARHKYPNSRIAVFARAEKEREFALELGAAWAGDTSDRAPGNLRAIVDATPVWKPVVEALRNLAPGGRLVVNAIRKEDVDKDSLLRLDYAADLWLEKEVKSVANVTRADVGEFLAVAAEIPLRPEVEEFRLEDANRALLEIKERRIRGAKVLRVSS